MAGFILLGLLTFWAAGFKIRTSTRPVDIPFLMLPHPLGIQLSLTAAVEIFALVAYLILKKIEPRMMTLLHENAEAVRQRGKTEDDE